MTARPWPFATEHGALDPPADAVARAVDVALAEDLGPRGDLTAALVPLDERAQLALVARAPGVVAGRRCAEAVFARVDPSITLEWHAPDGTAVVPGTLIATVTGPLHSILTAERSALNFLGHLSGIASLTRRFVDAVHAVAPDVRVLDTRKTTPGLRALEKAAVRAGGGTNHRSSLSEAVLVKDNHLGALGVDEAIARARTSWPGCFVEVECDRVDQACAATTAGADAVLLDNMTPDEVASCVAAVRREPGGDALVVEVSGGMTLESAPRYAAAGVDVLSVGALTHSAPSLDLGLDLVAQCQ